MIEVVLLWLVPILAACVLGVWLARRRPAMRTAAAALIAALPLPLVGLVLCAVLFAHAAFTPPARCGVDACGMAMAGAFFIGCGCVIVYGVSVLIAGLVIWKIRR